MPALPSSVLEPLWVQVAALLPVRQVPTHWAAIAPASLTGSCSTSSSRSWCSAAGIAASPTPPAQRPGCGAAATSGSPWALADRLWCAVLGAYDQLFGLELDHLAVDGCITKAPCGREVAGPNPVDRRKQGLQRSILTDADGLPLGAVPAAANCRDDLEKQLGHEIFCAPSWRIWISRYALSLER